MTVRHVCHEPKCSLSVPAKEPGCPNRGGLCTVKDVTTEPDNYNVPVRSICCDHAPHALGASCCAPFARWKAHGGGFPAFITHEADCPVAPGQAESYDEHGRNNKGHGILSPEGLCCIHPRSDHDDNDGHCVACDRAKAPWCKHRFRPRNVT